MAREIVTPRLFQMLLKHPNLRGISEQSLRTAIYRIRRRNPGVSMNAAAYAYASSKGVNVFRYLSTEDKQSLVFVRGVRTESNAAAVATGRTKRVVPPQLDFETPFADEAFANAQVYPYVYVLENGLRNVVLTKFSSTSDWWINPKVVPTKIQEYAKNIQESESKYGWLKARASHPIYYIGLTELFKIIERNWATTFKDVFPDLGSLTTWIKECVPIRNQIAHNVKIRQQEREVLKFRTDYICRWIEKWKGHS